ncbi:hypothetical protein PUNSTDRAFT_132490 [Punctularia strigosozonata HHB-11173 SS5]|uniref:uncharacterized protein n=1 Tax=Punctularia strigosozonata (strain HHB-11173) TaxID=741275 RepID=UPI000441814F|nr:uncharacterized protein PUNSTDRAFT_132490 [Punctularia strigosozonata HHB-11173 SS5]EIN10395.1 hypothetical protein PUNSTDRAFT_132490 [Punctularia strigosozonata HHB-11173 SS5]
MLKVFADSVECKWKAKVCGSSKPNRHGHVLSGALTRDALGLVFHITDAFSLSAWMSKSVPLSGQQVPITSWLKEPRASGTASQAESRAAPRATPAQDHKRKQARGQDDTEFLGDAAPKRSKKAHTASNTAIDVTSNDVVTPLRAAPPILKTYATRSMKKDATVRRVGLPTPPPTTSRHPIDSGPSKAVSERNMLTTPQTPVRPRKRLQSSKLGKLALNEKPVDVGAPALEEAPSSPLTELSNSSPSPRGRAADLADDASKVRPDYETETRLFRTPSKKVKQTPTVRSPSVVPSSQPTDALFSPVARQRFMPSRPAPHPIFAHDHNSSSSSQVVSSSQDSVVPTSQPWESSQWGKTPPRTKRNGKSPKDDFKIPALPLRDIVDGPAADEADRKDDVRAIEETTKETEENAEETHTPAERDPTPPDSAMLLASPQQTVAEGSIHVPGMGVIGMSTLMALAALAKQPQKVMKDMATSPIKPAWLKSKGVHVEGQRSIQSLEVALRKRSPSPVPSPSGDVTTSPLRDHEAHAGIGSLWQPDLWTGSLDVGDFSNDHADPETGTPSRKPATPTRTPRTIRRCDTWPVSSSDASPSAGRGKATARGSLLVPNSSPSPSASSKGKAVQRPSKGAGKDEGSETEPESDEDEQVASRRAKSLGSSLQPARLSPRHITTITRNASSPGQDREESPLPDAEEITTTQLLGAPLSIPPDYGMTMRSSQTASSCFSDGLVPSAVQDFLDMFDSQGGSYPPDFPESLK